MEADYLTLCRRLLTAFAGQEAGRAGVVWGRLKGFPTWPAQLLSDDVAAALPELGKRPREDAVAVMFFGDRTVAWVRRPLPGLELHRCWHCFSLQGWLARKSPEAQFACGQGHYECLQCMGSTVLLAILFLRGSGTHWLPAAAAQGRGGLG